MKDNDFNSFVMYHDFHEALEELDNEEAGILFKAIFNYQLGLDYTTDNKLVNVMLKTLIKTFERDRDKWLKIKYKRSEAAKTRWANQTKKETSKKKEVKPKELKKQKQFYGEFKKVELDQEQYNKAVVIYNEVDTKNKTTGTLNEAIEILDIYLENNPKKKYTNHYAVLNGWVKEKIIERSKPKTPIYQQKPVYEEPVYKKDETIPGYSKEEAIDILSNIF